FSEGAVRPPPLSPEALRPVHRESSGGDERLAVVVLYLLVVSEREQVFDVAPPLPQAAHPLRQHESARRRDGRTVERGEQTLQRIRGEDRVGVDGDGERCADVAEPNALRARLGAGVRGW